MLHARRLVGNRAATRSLLWTLDKTALVLFSVAETRYAIDCIQWVLRVTRAAFDKPKQQALSIPHLLLPAVSLSSAWPSIWRDMLILTAPFLSPTRSYLECSLSLTPGYLPTTPRNTQDHALLQGNFRRERFFPQDEDICKRRAMHLQTLAQVFDGGGGVFYNEDSVRTVNARATCLWKRLSKKKSFHKHHYRNAALVFGQMKPSVSNSPPNAPPKG